MTVVTTRTFGSGNSEVVRPPRDIVSSSDVELTGDLLKRLQVLPCPTEIEVRDVGPLPVRPGL